MKRKSRYRHFTALFLTALYLFIATPVQYWHHHVSHAATEFASENGSDHSDTGSTKIQGQHGDNCSICAHHYAVFVEDSHPPQLAFFPSLTSTYSLYRVTAITPLLTGFSNKGPPSML
ncbi:MAG: hypothetical protein ACTHMC_21235 [Pseudobacter sp.]|uniref:hypothetical protein n=1 Tax=Pseudobacter sp. TaxID=2045420 RepID=UPI003F7E8062